LPEYNTCQWLLSRKGGVPIRTPKLKLMKILGDPKYLTRIENIFFIYGECIFIGDM